MEIKASLKYLRIAPRKVRLVTELVKRLTLAKAEQQLKYNPKRASKDILKLLKSARANAVNNYQLDPNDLFISHINVTDGPTLKRIMPRARGSAYLIRHRTCHVDLSLKSTKGKTIKVDKEKVTKKTKKRVVAKKGTTTSKVDREKGSVKASKGVAKNIVQRKVIN
jgi:large subunit ribosomal protein L22